MMFVYTECQLMRLDKPKPNTFVIRGLQMTNIVERMFCVDTAEERLIYLFYIPFVFKAGGLIVSCDLSDINN